MVCGAISLRLIWQTQFARDGQGTAVSPQRSRHALAVQVLFTSVFAQQSNAVLIGKNLKAFYWTYEHKVEIQAACGGGLPS
jgi:hypothetical protein